MSSIKFAHITLRRHNKVKGGGTQEVDRRATVGYTRNFETGEINFAIAECDERDHYIKSKGRTIVEGRLRKGGHNSSGKARSQTFNVSSEAKYGDIIQHIIHVS